jgi:hypothetical protein
MNCKIRCKLCVINNISVYTLTSGRVISLGNNSPPAETSVHVDINTLPTMVCDQAFRVLPITDNSPPRGLYISTTRRRSEELCVFDTWEPSPVYNRVITKSISSNGSRHLKGPLYTDSPSTQIHKVTLRML